MSQKTKIAIVGGGIAGSTAALYLSSFPLEVTIFEKKDSFISGPPFCHLHAGGNLYREISDDQCITLLHQSIDLLRFYPYGIDYRPTVIITPISDPEDPKALLRRLEILKNEYQKSIDNDPKNSVFGASQEYYKVYEKDSLLKLQNQKELEHPNSFDEWLIPIAKKVDLRKVKFPIIIVKEYGLNLFRISAGISLQLINRSNCTTFFDTEVTNITHNDKKYQLTYKKHGGEIFTKEYDYLINAAGFQTGVIDDMLGFSKERFVEFKAAYVSKWEDSTCKHLWPEIIFHGKRGTPQGMAQFTPYQGGYFQLHGMTNDITLFDNGLVQNDKLSAQPILDSKFTKKIDCCWEKEDVEKRTTKAIEHISQYIPQFKSAKVGSKPLFGAQQIPGNDKDLRAADVTFEGDTYARCEVVKASSVLSMIDLIMEKLYRLGFIKNENLHTRDLNYPKIEDEKITSEAKKICQKRDYPLLLGELYVQENSV